jgi:hypothetical protein
VQFLERMEAHRNGQPLSLKALQGADTIRVDGRFGPVDLLREGAPPLDFDTVHKGAINLTFHGQLARVASLSSLVAFKRLADRPRDRLDLMELERIHGPLPIEAVPGLDS